MLGCDAKRVHLFHSLHHAEDGYQAATIELMLMHVDLTARKSSPLPAGVRDRIGRLAAAHATLARPAEVGRVIALPTRPGEASAPG